MKTDFIISIILALGGWGFGLYQLFKNRDWQHKDLLANRRYEEYHNFMKKIEEINVSFRNNPNMIYGISTDFINSLYNKNPEEIDEALSKYNQKLLDYVKSSIQPLLIINQEINPLLLIASDELIIKLNRFKELISDFNNEMQNCLSNVSIKDANSFKALETIGYDKRWKEFEKLNEDIIELMRKEINK
jgi:hypothetical protein